jgi:murein DD-endopeptidase MepM/ murein hydrolase activator NlpD
MAAKHVLIALAVAVIPIRSVGAAGDSRLRTSLTPPVSPACISSTFGPRVLPNLPAAGDYHYGIDLPAAEGAVVVAAAPGTVIRVQNKYPGGLEVLIQHDGFVGVYSHFGSIHPAIAEGTMVAAGARLGVVGRTGITSGAHLYFGMILAGKPVDPAQYLGVRLCDGTLPRPQREQGMRNAGTTMDGRKYYQIFFPERQYHQWRQQ